MSDFQPPRQPGPPIAGAPTTPPSTPSATETMTSTTAPTSAFEPPRPPVAPTHRTRDRKAGRFAVGVALGALVGASVAGGIVAVARVTSSPWFDRNGYGQVNWKLQLLPPELWILSADMKSSGHWQGKVPFTTNKQATSPVELDTRQWNWIAGRLPKPALKWLSDHAK